MGRFSDLQPVAPEQSETPSVPYIPKVSRLGKYLKASQKYSAYCICAFAGLHLSSTYLLPAVSVPAANSAFMVARDVYQSAFGELLLVYGAFGVHILSGFSLRILRMYRQYVDYGKAKVKFSWTSITGIILTVLITGHYGAMRWAPVAALGDSSLVSLDYITYLLNTPSKAKSYASLTLLTTFFGLHALQGGSQYFRFIRRLWKGSFNKILVTSAISLWCALSLTALSKGDIAQGWMASQFDHIHHTFEALISLRN